MATTSVWRTFKFFEQDSIKAPRLETLEITAAACGRNHIYCGDAEGTLRVFERSSMTLQSTFEAYAKIVTHMKMLRSSRNVLVCIGDDDSANEVGIVRVWDFERRGAGGAARVTREVRLFGAKVPLPGNRVPVRVNYNPDMLLRFFGNKDDSGAADGAAAAPAVDGDIGTSQTLLSPVVCFDVADDLQHLAVALTDGRIIIVRGDIERDRAALKTSTLRSRYANGTVTFVGFPKLRDTTAAAPAFHSLLFAVYDDISVVFPLPARNKELTAVEERPFEPAVGAAPECAALNDDGELYVASNASPNVVVYGGDAFVAEKRQAWDGNFTASSAAQPMPPIDGEKRKLTFHRHYLVLLLRPEPDRRPEKFTLAVFDRDLRIRAVTLAQGSQVNPSWVLPDISDVLVIAQLPKTEHASHRLVKYVEVDRQAKLDQLFKKDMYEEAQRIARHFSSQHGADDSSDITRRYGDHLYDKGKYDEAVKQYVLAIRGTEPSYVIRKFLGEQRIGNLTTYLEALHENEHGHLANRNHTTLLLNCYAKLKDEAKMAAFIRREDITFDATNAIHVCRQAGYFDAATYLAAKYDQPTEYVKILLENLGKHEQALDYVYGLGLIAAEKIMLEHGRLFLSHLATEATRLLIKLCTNWVPTANASHGRSAAPAAPAAAPRQAYARAEPFIPAFVDTPQALMQFLEAVVTATFRRTAGTALQSTGAFDESTAEVLNTLLELYLTPDLPERVRHGDAGKELADAAAPRGGATALTAPRERLNKAYELLRDYPGQYDPYHALMLCQRHEFESGVIHLLGALNLHSEIFVFYAKQFNSAPTLEQRMHAKRQLFHTCEESDRQGGSRSDAARDIWVSLLSLLVRSKDDVEEDITTLLARVEHDDLLPPVAVIEILAAEDKLQLRAVRQYIVSMLQRDQHTIDAAQREIAELSTDASRLRTELGSLQTSAQVFQTSKCQQCDEQLDLPAVHFLCGHGFHQRCLSDVRECNICATRHRRHQQLVREFDEAADSHERFFAQLRSAPDGFSVVAEQFGRGIFTTRRARDVDAAGSDEDADDADLFGMTDDAINELESW